MIEHERIAAEFADLESNGFSGAVGIVDDASTPVYPEFRRSDPSNDGATLFDICSVTKSFTAAAILQLESRGLLSFGQSLDLYFDLPPALGRITIHQLLTHSSGLCDFLSPRGEPREYSLEYDYEPLARDGLLQRIRHSRLRAAPGERWSYSNTGYSLLAAIIELVTGQEFEVYLRRELLLPLAIFDTGYTVPVTEQARVASGRIGAIEWGRPTDKAAIPSWNLIGNGGLLSTITELLRWRTAFGTLLVDACTTPIEVAPNIWSGYGCFIRRTDPALGDVFYHNGDNGVFSATIRWFPKLSRYLAVVSNDSKCSALQVARRISECWKH